MFIHLRLLGEKRGGSAIPKTVDMAFLSPGIHIFTGLKREKTT